MLRHKLNKKETMLNWINYDVGTAVNPSSLDLGRTFGYLLKRYKNVTFYLLLSLNQAYATFYKKNMVQYVVGLPQMDGRA